MAICVAPISFPAQPDWKVALPTVPQIAPKFDPQALQDLATQMLAQREVKEVPETEADFEEMSVSKPATPIWVS